MELVIFLVLFAASVTVGLAGARAFLYVLFRFLMRATTAAPLTMGASTNSAS